MSSIPATVSHARALAKCNLPSHELLAVYNTISRDMMELKMLSPAWVKLDVVRTAIRGLQNLQFNVERSEMELSGLSTPSQLCNRGEI